MRNFYLLLVLILSFSFANASDNLKKEKLKKSTAVVSHDVFFSTDKYSLTSEEFQKLLHFIQETETIDIERMSIYGFCDDLGSDDYNKQLSNKRATYIRNIISTYRNSDKKPELVSVDAKGEIALTTQEQSLFDELRALNRKVTIVIAPKKLIAGSFYGEDLSSGDLINLEKINFRRGLRYLTEDSKASLNELADYLSKRTDIFFTINGHVCCTKNGKDSRDRETGKVNLSVVRAKYIRDYLVKRGVDASRIRYQGLAGKYNLGGDDKEDRRVELLVRYISK
ncbi:OmpA family protein [uncultured Lacinutrix sp.]|uniref:OmpA family protein n=1 Tax=uncultured Lacinutrix sp. TaxID=574032 RepID=UPI0026249409|nr:OmpA family protein [uncultured Lacinutrix sp.]